MGILEPGGDLANHCTLVLDALARGRVVPFLGAGVNLCGRPEGEAWTATETKYLPKGRELAEYLAHRFHYPLSQEQLKNCPDPAIHLDLARVSQYVATLLDEGPLNDELRAIFAPPALSGPARPSAEDDLQPTLVHRFFAGLKVSQPERPEDTHLLIVTTNYDTLMEKALGPGSYDLVFYDADAEPRPIFRHVAPDGTVYAIGDATSYAYEFFRNRPVVLKVHGTVAHGHPENESFVITEDHYIEYLSEEPMEKLLPRRLLQKMREKHHLLFLGYSLRDWNFRVFLQRLNRNPRQRYRPWAVLLGAEDVEKKSWARKGVDMVNLDLELYIKMLMTHLQGPARQDAGGPDG